MTSHSLSFTNFQNKNSVRVHVSVYERDISKDISQSAETSATMTSSEGGDGARLRARHCSVCVPEKQYAEEQLAVCDPGVENSKVQGVYGLRETELLCFRCSSSECSSSSILQ